MNLSIEEQALVARVRVLPPEKLAEVIDFIDFIATRASYGEISTEAQKEQLLQQKLLEKGLLSEIKPLVTTASSEWQPILNIGKSLSEVILEERR